MSSDLRRKVLLSLVFALLVYIALVFYGDWRLLTSALATFPWAWIVPVLALTLLNYGGRALRWHWYMRLLGVPISLRDSTRVFAIGLLMVMTPGKAGEFLKSYMIKNIAGTPISVTAPAPLAERMLDGVAMLVLAAAGLFAIPDTTARVVAGLVFLIFLAFVVVVQNQRLALWLLGMGERLPVVNRFAAHLHRFYESAAILFGLRNLAIGLLIGMACWGAQGVAYYLVLVGLGAAPGPETLLLAVFIFCISTVIGAAVALPGGLGGMEGSLVALSVRLLAFSASTATAAALLIRFCTLWLGVLVGVVSFLLWPDLLAGSTEARRREEMESITTA